MEMLNHYFCNPNEIEAGFKPLFKEFGAGNWKRIDILGIDKKGFLCVVEIKTQEGTKTEKICTQKQVLKYRSSLLRLFHALRLNIPIRVLVITPNQKIDFGTSSSFDPHSSLILDNDLPTSRKLFGLGGRSLD